MTIELYKVIQTRMAKDLTYTGKIDGDWGGGSERAFATGLAKGIDYGDGLLDIAWSKKVTPQFTQKVKTIAQQLKLTSKGPHELMGCMAFESGETFSPTIRNGAGAPYYGIIQFGEAAAKDAGTTLPALLKMSAEEQLDYVYKFFKPYTGKLFDIGDIYMRILWPAAVGKPANSVIWDQKTRPTTYVQNKGLDINGDKLITKAEAIVKVQQKLDRGMSPLFRRPL
ncbi:putative D-alanyl-D-alanin carboxypeptidase [Erwinia phage vB_EamM_Phobos]|uniref:putative D-alanyl-D-alanin carboxypeptidase n=1 Tax=Erwinia phage vB_EamM_Phobos TaxID=1883377 RepID=UPI00081D0C04|nr:putative D-alanyl-D-alanin carboxypeptidase [Erwinia phage vB_EamM_Phobos]ANZ50277.1 putative D-alanyl-D-alanin carboxypeptidase [Erwinia phage vB_EamM_Phobos]